MSHKIADISMINKYDHNIFEDSAFIYKNNFDLRKVVNENDDSDPPSSSSSSNNKKYKENVFKLRNNPKKDMKLRNKSRVVGSHGT